MATNAKTVPRKGTHQPQVKSQVQVHDQERDFKHNAEEVNEQVEEEEVVEEEEEEEEEDFQDPYDYDDFALVEPPDQSKQHHQQQQRDDDEEEEEDDEEDEGEEENQADGSNHGKEDNDLATKIVGLPARSRRPGRRALRKLKAASRANKTKSGAEKKGAAANEEEEEEEVEEEVPRLQQLKSNVRFEEEEEEEEEEDDEEEEEEEDEEEEEEEEEDEDDDEEEEEEEEEEEVEEVHEEVDARVPQKATSSKQQEQEYVDKMLQMFNTIRQRLFDEGLRALPTDFKIVEENLDGYLGVTHTIHDDLEEFDEDKKVYRVNRVESVGIRFRNEQDGALIPPKNLIAVLLHELAHAMTPASYIRKKKEKKDKRYEWVMDHHSDEFYHNFSYILRLAEKLNIFVLPKTSNKLSRRSLRRFDAIDHDAMALPDYCVPNLRKALAELKLGEFTDNEFKVSPDSLVKLPIPQKKFTVRHALRVCVVALRKQKEETKTFVIRQRTLQRLYTDICNKFNFKVKKITLLKEGTEVDQDDMLLEFEDGVELRAV